MKKILFALVALMCSMSMNAQVMKVMKGDVVVKTYKGSDYKVVFEEETLETTGTATRTGNIDVKWVQLWENGPKFAEYNVGVTDGKAESYGGLYCWGGNVDKDQNAAYNRSSNALTGNSDTATNLWGSNWRMPTKAEFEALIANCSLTMTQNYKETGVKGLVCTGKGDYSENSIFLPASGYYFYEQKALNLYCDYWTSTPDETDTSMAYNFDYSIYGAKMSSVRRGIGDAVRAVLVEE